MGEEEAQLHSEEQVSEIAQEQEQQPTESTDYSWTPPSICFSVPPARTYHFSHQFRTPSNPNNFLKGVKWYNTFYTFHPPFPFPSLRLSVCLSETVLLLGRRTVRASSRAPRTTLFVFSHCKFFCSALQLTFVFGKYTQIALCCE